LPINALAFLRLEQYRCLDHFSVAFLVPRLRETLNKSAFYGEPAQLCDAGSSKINGLPQLIQVQKFLFLFNQHFLSLSLKINDKARHDVGTKLICASQVIQEERP